MSKRNDLPWYRWYPYRALSSLSWLNLTLEEEGYYRRLYDLASQSQPATKRGWLYQEGRVMSLKDIHIAARVEQTPGIALMERMVYLKLISRNPAGAYGFKNYGKHQRKAPLQPRYERTKARQKRDKAETKSGQNPAAEYYSTRVLERKENKRKESGDSLARAPNSFSSLVPQGLQEKFGSLIDGASDLTPLLDWLPVYGPDEISKAIDLAKASSKPTVRYCKGILENRALLRARGVDPDAERPDFGDRPLPGGLKFPGGKRE